MSNERDTPSFDDYEPASEAASRTLASVDSEDTEPERLLQASVAELGLEFESHRSDLPGSPDLVFPDARVAVFCDGDFWHGRNWEERRERLKRGANSEYWIEKIQSNRERDVRQTKELEDAGWQVLRVWEGDIKEDPNQAAEQVMSVLLEADCGLEGQE